MVRRAVLRDYPPPHCCHPISPRFTPPCAHLRPFNYAKATLTKWRVATDEVNRTPKAIHPTLVGYVLIPPSIVSTGYCCATIIYNSKDGLYWGAVFEIVCVLKGA